MTLIFIYKTICITWLSYGRTHSASYCGHGMDTFRCGGRGGGRYENGNTTTTWLSFVFFFSHHLSCLVSDVTSCHFYNEVMADSAQFLEQRFL